MTDRPTPYEIRRERADRWLRLRAADLSNLAVLEIEGLPARPRPYTREVAIAFGDGHPCAAWLVAPEPAWTEPCREPNRLADGRGLHPAELAGALTAALAGRRVVASDPRRTNVWLARLFEAAAVPRGIRVENLEDVRFPPGEHYLDLPAIDLQRAEHANALLYPPSDRAALAAVAHMAFLTALRDMRQRRDMATPTANAAATGRPRRARST